MDNNRFALWHILIRRGRYVYRVTSWRLLVTWRRVSRTLRRQSDLIRRVGFVIVGLLLGWVVTHFDSGMSANTLSGYLVAVGVMAGGTIAIVFAISVFLLQSSSDLYSSPYLDEYIHDWREKFIYSTVILVTLGLIAGGILVDGASLLPQPLVRRVVFWSLGSVGLVFALIDWQYRNVREKINPLKAILFLEGRIVGFIDQMQRDAERVAGILLARDDEVSEELALASVYAKLRRAGFAELDGQLGQLADIAVRLHDRREIETCKRSVMASVLVLRRYLEARSTSSVSVPSSVTVLASESDSERLLARSFERLNAIAERFLNDGDEELAVHVLSGYAELGTTAAGMRFVGPTLGNPIYSRLVAYAGFLIESAQRAGKMEVVFQGVRVIADLAKLATDHGYDSSLQVLVNHAKEAATFGITQKHVVVVDRCTLMLLGLIPATFASTRINRRYQAASVLEHLAQLASSMAMLSNRGMLPQDFAWQSAVAKPIDGLGAALGASLQQYGGLEADEKKRTCRHDLIDFLEELNRQLRWLAEALRSADSPLVGSIARAVFEINQAIVKLLCSDEFADVHADLRRRLEWNIHLPPWFPHYATRFAGGSLAFRELVDCVAKTGILSAHHLDDPDLVSECVKAVHSMAEKCLAKTVGGYGYDEPRALVEACYLGALALKRGWLDVFYGVRRRILDFEPQFVAKYLSDVPAGIDPMKHNVSGLPHHDQVCREVLRWRRDLWERRPLSPLGDAEAMIASLVSVVDVDRFIFEVWRVLVSGSRVEAERTTARAQLLVVLEEFLAVRQHA